VSFCKDGVGNFDAEFRTEVRVHVGAARSEGLVTLATRACAAKLSRKNQDVVVATGASQLDLDAFGVDMGDGVPVAAFQIKSSDAACCMEYRIYSLEKMPRLLRTIAGGDFYSAADIGLDGSVEIWTHDAAAVNGFENLALSELDYSPAIALRFAHGQLADVSVEFQSYFDDQITTIRAGIHSEDLEDFKASDGNLVAIATPSSAERLHRLRMVKIKILEIVWAYLYSGRDQDAWRVLAEMWPSADIERIRAALLSARASGIRSQADHTSAGPAPGKKKHAQIFDAVSKSGPGARLEVTPPAAILLERPPTSDVRQSDPADRDVTLELVVDGAGKVGSAEPVGKMKGADPELVNAALRWKFIPASKGGRPVASRLRLEVSLQQ
jgi:hypothetical protein